MSTSSSAEPSGAPGLDPNITERKKTQKPIQSQKPVAGSSQRTELEEIAGDVASKNLSGSATDDATHPVPTDSASMLPEGAPPGRKSTVAPHISIGRTGASFNAASEHTGTGNDRFLVLGNVRQSSDIWGSNSDRTARLMQSGGPSEYGAAPMDASITEMDGAADTSAALSQTDEDTEREDDAMNLYYPKLTGLDRLLEIYKHRLERMTLRGYKISSDEIEDTDSHLGGLDNAMKDEGMAPTVADKILLITRRLIYILLARSSRRDKEIYDEMQTAIEVEQAERGRIEEALQSAMARLATKPTSNTALNTEESMDSTNTNHINRRAVTPALQRALNVMTSRVVLQHLRESNTGGTSDVEDQNVRSGDDGVVYALSDRKDYWVPTIFSVDDEAPQRLKVNVAKMIGLPLIPVDSVTDDKSKTVSPTPPPHIPGSFPSGGNGSGGGGGGGDDGGGGNGGSPRSNSPNPPRGVSRLGNSPAADALRNTNEQSLIDRLITTYRDRVGKELVLPKDAKPMRVDPKITKYAGGVDFHVLEKWVVDVAMYFELSHLGGKGRDTERLNLMMTYLDGAADVWYRNRVLSIYRDKKEWSSEDVIVGLFTRFIKTITLHDNAYRFEGLKWRNDHTVDNFYDEMIDMANLMAIRPSESELKKKFTHNLPGIYSDGMIDRGFDLVMNPLELLLEAARAQEVSAYDKGKMAQRRNKDANPRPAVLDQMRMRSRTVVRPLGGRGGDGAVNPISNAKPVSVPNPMGRASPNTPSPLRQTTTPTPRASPVTKREPACWDCGKNGVMRGHPGCPSPNTNNARPPRPAHIRAAYDDEVEEDNDVGGAFDPVIEDDDLNAQSNLEFDPRIDPYEIIEYEVYNDENNDRWDSLTMSAMSDVATEVDFKGRGSGKIKLRVRKEPYSRPELPLSEKRCLATFIELGDGCAGLALWDSGSTTSSVSPQYASIAKLDIRKLKQPVQLFLGTVGSRSMINFGAIARANLPTVTESDYFDVVNLDRYDILIGAPFMHKYGVQLDFSNKCIRIGDETLAADIVPVNEEALQRYRMRRAGEADGQEADMSTN